MHVFIFDLVSGLGPRPRFALDWEECFHQLTGVLTAANLLNDAEGYVGAWFIRTWLVHPTQSACTE